MATKKWKDYLYFSKAERVALYVLTAIILFVASLNFFIPRLHSNASIDFSEFLNDIEKFRDGIPEGDENEERNLDYDQHTKPLGTYDLFVFDPNTATSQELTILGLNSYAIKNLLKYRAKGGKLIKKEDFRKVYGVDQDLYNRLEPFIQISNDRINEGNTNLKHEKSNEKLILDIGKASADEFQQIIGIGPVFSKRIVDYRESLGGFYSIDQIREVYGIDSSLFDRIKSQLVLNEIAVMSVSVNLAEIKEMAAHPYISYDLAKLIYNERVKNGPFMALNELKTRISDLQTEHFEKIKPYLVLW